MRNNLKSLLVAGVALGIGSIASASDHIAFGFNPGGGFEPIGSVGGGYPNSQVLSGATLGGWINRLVTTTVAPRDFGVALYASDSPTLYNLLSTGFASSNYFFSGDFAAVDSHGGYYRQYHFSSGFFADVVFPALDVTATSSSVATLKVQPLVATLIGSTGSGTPPSLGYSTKVAWSQSNFSVTVDGVTIPAKHVAGIQVMQQGIQGSPFGLTKDPSDIVITVPQATASALASVPLNSTHTVAVAYYDTLGNKIGTLTASGAIYRSTNEDGMADGPNAMVNVSYTSQTESFAYHS